jgi:YihY family inner membrane protein
MVLSLGSLFLLSIVVSALPAFPVLESIDPVFGEIDFRFDFLLTLLLFFLMYYWLPNCKVRRRTALIGALLSGAMWEGAKTGFRLYLVSGLANYGAIYGSLASVIALILWAYLTGMILLIGAEFGAKIQGEFWPVSSEAPIA